MSAAEIEQEREQSGWNPYVGEEEGEINEEIKEPLPGTEFAQTDCPVPYAGYVQMEEWLKEDKKEAQDLRRLQTLYPAAAKQLLPYIEEVCDQMEYSGSMMFDEYPDSETMFRLQEDLLSRMKEESEAQTKAGSRTQPEMPSLVPEASPAGAEPLQELTRVLLLQEMHRRRSRHRRILAVSG